MTRLFHGAPLDEAVPLAEEAKDKVGGVLGRLVDRVDGEPDLMAREHHVRDVAEYEVQHKPWRRHEAQHRQHDGTLEEERYEEPA